MMNERLLFVYRGKISERNSLPLITLIENEMKSDSYSLSGRKRLFMFVLESIQNIIKHGDNDHADMSLVTYAKNEEGYSITTGNIVETGHAKDLESRLVQINRSDEKGIKSLYLEILDKSELSRKGGAGLGLLEMAIKTGNRLDYDFVPIDDKHTYFLLNKTVNKSGMGINPGGKINIFKRSPVTEIEQIMARNNIYMIWSGHFSPEVGDEVLSLTETKISGNDLDLRIRKRIFYIQVEILENLSKYNPGRDSEEKHGLPIVMIRFDGQRFILSTGNLIVNSEVEGLKAKLDAINSNNIDLREMFSESLSSQTIDSDSTGNMGLIDIARKSGSKLIYSFEKVNEMFSYYFLTVKIRIDNHQ
ncbi:MAG: hypothetical protein GYA41_10425 [Bacteroidales bacterium]|nr:hypothetical protein [Bacteroidales bacterium]